ncbi:hypothetical protein [Ferroacidibacillus organovorans]|uniref:Uncharacterized protein n=1 Tax=Ferroacidibacillus organovorans TaxID=1765683 RepID=A0A117SXW6_9BACL|nr:hypothetical protein [Ferroacidibacillus organovorans]KUO96125.1 hypothetical protein ATW55_14425 [Ferroacidibacillus organovorans]
MALENRKSLLKIRFIGEELSEKSVPIYDLGESLISVQRLVHKAYLETRGYHKGRQQLSSVERRKLALQISARQKQSDSYLLDAFLASHPILTGIYSTTIGACISEMITAVAVYSKKQIHTMFDSRTKPKEPANSAMEAKLQFIINLYSEVATIANRVNNTSRVTQVELHTQDDFNLEKVQFDIDNRDYIRSLYGEKFTASESTITGLIESLNIARQTATVRTPSGIVNVKMKSTDFAKVRYEAVDDSAVTFKGNYVIQIGKNTHGKLDFEASSIEDVTSTDFLD